MLKIKIPFMSSGNILVYFLTCGLFPNILVYFLGIIYIAVIVPYVQLYNYSYLLLSMISKVFCKLCLSLTDHV